MSEKQIAEKYKINTLFSVTPDRKEGFSTLKGDGNEILMPSNWATTLLFHNSALAEKDKQIKELEGERKEYRKHIKLAIVSFYDENDTWENRMKTSHKHLQDIFYRKARESNNQERTE